MGSTGRSPPLHAPGMYAHIGELRTHVFLCLRTCASIFHHMYSKMFLHQHAFYFFCSNLLYFALLEMLTRHGFTCSFILCHFTSSPSFYFHFIWFIRRVMLGQPMQLHSALMATSSHQVAFPSISSSTSWQICILLIS